MNREEIKKILPHREPMLLIDEAEVTDNNRATGKYLVKGTEWFLQGHFPGNPVVPGVILCEIMAQTCGVILAETAIGKTSYFTSLDNVKFKEKVRPGDLFIIDVKITRSRGAFYFAEGSGSVNGKICVTAEFSFAMIADR